MPSGSDEEDWQVPVIEQLQLVTPVGNCGAKHGRHNDTSSNAVASPVCQQNSCNRDGFIGTRLLTFIPSMSLIPSLRKAGESLRIIARIPQRVNDLYMRAKEYMHQGELLIDEGLLISGRTSIFGA